MRRVEMARLDTENDPNGLLPGPWLPGLTHHGGMRPGRTSLIVGALLRILPAAIVASVLSVGPLATSPASAAAPPVHTLVVTGTGVGSYPAFDPGIERYAVTTTAATGGTITVHATTTEPAGVVRVDGRVAPGGTATVTGLDEGDEVAVFIEDSAGVEVHALVYLPAGFPALTAVASSPAVAAGDIGLTLLQVNPSVAQYTTTVDRNGVPTHVEQLTGGFDLKQQPDGSTTLAEPVASPGRTGSATVVRDDHWNEVARYTTLDPLTNTDDHDSVLLPDHSRFLLASEPNPVSGMTDAVVQEVDAQGQVVFQWSSAGLEDQSVRPSSDPDYAHVNSVQVVGPDRDVVVSMRHLSSVYRIATRPHDGYAKGQVIWRLGGRSSTFSFVDDPYGGPCAQHTASVLPNGHVLLFDDGSGGVFAPALCLDQADPEGDPFIRTQSRAVEYALDEVHGTATEVWSYTPIPRYAPFMGSTSRLGNGDTLIGWGGSTQALASEVDADANLLWELKVASPAPYISYRASLMHVPDAIAPVVDQVSLADGSTFAVGQLATVDFRCTDRGGASLRTCGGDARPGGRLDTSTPGPHTVHLTATDGAGQTTTVMRSYTVVATYQPRWGDDRVRRTLSGKRVATKVRVVNDGTFADSFRLAGDRGNAGFRVRYVVAGEDVTSAVRRGRFRSAVLQPGEALVLRVVVASTNRTRAGAQRTFKVRATSVADAARRDVVRVVRASARSIRAPASAGARGPRGVRVRTT